MPAKPLLYLIDGSSQMYRVHRACEALGVPIITHVRYEADDVIGTMTERAAAEGYGVAIVTGDKDFFQLVRDDIRVFNPREDGTWYDAAGVKEKFGVAPEQVVDVLALMGDAIDNVKGVPGVGERGARELIATYGSLDALLEHAAEVKQKKYREALLAHAAEARASRELLRIHTNVPVPFDISDFRYTGPAQAACYALFSELGFSSLMMEYAPTAETTTKDYRLVTTSAELQALVEELRGAGRFALRVFGDGSAAVTSNIVGLALAPGNHAARVARYVPLRHHGMHNGPQLTADEALRALAPLLENPSFEKIGHDLKTDAVVLARHGVTLNGLGLDTMLASYLLDAARSGHSLETAALEHLRYRALTEEDVCGKGAKAVALADTPPAAALTYTCERADLAL